MVLRIICVASRGIRCIYRTKRTLRNGKYFCMAPLIVGAALGEIPVVILFSNLTAASCKEKPFYIHQTHFFALYSKLQLAQGFIGFTVNTVVAAGAIDSLH